jgi:hypothetical protein
MCATEEAVGIDRRAACSIDGPTDDYEIWHEEPSPEIQKVKEALCVPKSQMSTKPHILPRTFRTEAVNGGSPEVVLLISGAWKTYCLTFHSKLLLTCL